MITLSIETSQRMKLISYVTLFEVLTKLSVKLSTIVISLGSSINLTALN